MFFEIGSGLGFVRSMVAAFRRLLYYYIHLYSLLPGFKLSAVGETERISALGFFALSHRASHPACLNVKPMLCTVGEV